MYPPPYMCVYTAGVFYMSFVLVLYANLSISTEHLEVILALCWTGWLVPISIMNGYYCLLAVSQIKPICLRVEAYHATERTFS